MFCRSVAWRAVLLQESFLGGVYWSPPTLCWPLCTAETRQSKPHISASIAVTIRLAATRSVVLLLLLRFNMCNHQLLRSYKRHEENKSKIGQDRSSTQQADNQCFRLTPWMQESVSMNKKHYPSQAFAHESSNVRGRGKREEERQERQRPGGWWKERQPNKTKTHLRN